MKRFVRFFLYLLPGSFTVTLLACNYRRIGISPGSIGPLAAIGIMLLMYFIYHSDDVSATGYHVISSTAEMSEETQLRYMYRFARILLSMLPLQLIFVFLVPNAILKAVCAVVVVFATFLVDVAVNAIQPIERSVTQSGETDGASAEEE